MTVHARRIGRYDLLREIGRGEMGTVFEAFEPGKRTLVAVKFFDFNDDVEKTAAVTDALLLDAERAAHLRHPNIVAILDSGVHEGRPYIVMERLEARSLRQLLDALPRMAFEWVRSIVLQAADALDYAHARGMVHGDLKPSNILVDNEGRVKLTDFVVAHTGLGCGLRPGVLPAMPQYMSPEQVRGESPDARSDLFSLGAILFEMLAGRPPFGSPLTGSLVSVLENIAHAPTPTPSAVDPEVPADLDMVVMKALAKSPASRYASAAQMSSDLRRGTDMNLASPAPAPVPPPVPTPAPPVPEPSPSLRRGQSSDPLAASEARVEDNLAALAADIDAFAARAEQELRRADAPERTPPAYSPAHSDIAFPTLTGDTPAQMPEGADVPVPQAPATAVASEVPVSAPPSGPSGLLAQLAEQAERIRSHGEQMQRGQQAARTQGERLLTQNMREAYRYLLQLSQQLNVIKPQVTRDFSVLGLGVFRALAWNEGDADFRTRGAQAPDHVAQVMLGYSLHGQTRLRVEREGPAIDTLRTALRENGLRFEEQQVRDEFNRLRHCVFDVAPEVRARIVLRADYDRLGALLTLQNVERFGTSSYQLEVAEIRTELFEELAKSLLGQPSRFASMVRLIVPAGNA